MTHVEGAIIELRRLAVAQAEPRPLQRLVVERDEKGNAVSYTREPVGG